MTDTSLLFEVTEEPDAGDVKVVDDGLGAFNEAAADLDGIAKFACFARDDSGRVVGGALARWWGAACEVQVLWVDEPRRRQGLGAELMRQAEAHARQLGCDLLYLETFTFQAPEFYASLGYEVACELPGFPNGASKFILSKRLDAGR